MLDPDLLGVLVCPASKGPLELSDAGDELLCRTSGLAYPVRDGIPHMLADEARELSSEELEALQAK